MNKAVFLDRDGVLNREIGTYVWEPARFEVLPGVAESLIRLKAAGYHLIVVTNQAGIARGLYTATDVQARDMAAAEKVGVRGLLVGPDEPAGYSPRTADLPTATDFILSSR